MSQTESVDPTDCVRKLYVISSCRWHEHNVSIVLVQMSQHESVRRSVDHCGRARSRTPVYIPRRPVDSSMLVIHHPASIAMNLPTTEGQLARLVLRAITAPTTLRLHSLLHLGIHSVSHSSLALLYI